LNFLAGRGVLDRGYPLQQIAASQAPPVQLLNTFSGDFSVNIEMKWCCKLDRRPYT